MIYNIKATIDDSIFPSVSELKRMDIIVTNRREEFASNAVCYHYAFDNDNLNSCRQAYNILESSYYQIPIEKAKRGDIISYHEISGLYKKPCCNNAVHFAKIKKTNGTIQGTIIKSKWGNYHVFKSNISNVTDIYGNAIVIWRKRRNKNVL